MTWNETPQSSAIAGYRYIEASRVLVIAFTSGTRYCYYEVPESVLHGLERAISKGEYFAEHIRDVYRYTRA